MNPRFCGPDRIEKTLKSLTIGSSFELEYIRLLHSVLKAVFHTSFCTVEHVSIDEVPLWSNYEQMFR